MSKPRLLFRPDPVLGWSLSPEHAVRVGFRQGVVQHIDATGWRNLPRPAKMQGPRIAIYGCSFTYGTALSDAETYPALIQQALPEVHVLNRGIGGHGTTQNLLQFRRDIAMEAVDAAVFAIIGDHRFRNIAHPHRMRQYLSPEWYKLGVEHVPVARLEASGRARIVYRPIWQPAIRQADFDIFLPDDHMINVATFAVLDLVRETARAAQVPVRFVVLDAIDTSFNDAIQRHVPDVHDISTPYDEAHTFLPTDIHPNVHANTLFAERLIPLVGALCAETTRGGPR